MRIEMPRGDIRTVCFAVQDSAGGATEITFTEIYFTVKHNFSEKSFLFQKKQSDGSIEQLDDGTFQFTIESEDTDGLRIGNYVFDIELVSGQVLKQTTVGELVLTNEVTFAENEE